MTKNTCIVLLILLLALLSLQSARCEDKPKETPGAGAAEPKKTMIWDYEKELGLAKEQVEQLKTVEQERREETFVYTRRAKAEEQDLVRLVDEGNDLDRIHAKLQEIARLRAEISFCSIRAALLNGRILKEPQLRKWKEIQDKESGESK